jgi:hypothetical protein
MRLTAGQACYIFGWFQAKHNLLWEDVIKQPHITFKLLRQANISLDSLYNLQPDTQQWIKEKKIFKDDLFQIIGKWECDPVRDFQLDIGDLTDSRFSVDVLLNMGMTYEKMVDMGLTSENMRLFRHVTLLGWNRLGLNKEHARKIPENHLYACFSMKKNDVLMALNE